MTEKKYNDINDFLEDESFNNWVLQKNGADVSFWEYWIANNQDKKEHVNIAKDLILGISFNTNEISEQKVALEWNKFQSKINSKQVKPKRKIFTLTNISVAATILVFITIGSFLFNKNTKVTHKTYFGEILNVKLQDGSDVTLNSNSSLYYYKNDSRKVWLNGEAFFKVDKKKSTNAKFLVITEDLSVKVYGTAFNVNTKKKKTDVFLEEGDVWLSLKNGEVKKMQPGNYISYSAEENKILENKNINNYSLQTSWKDGSLFFDMLSLEKAMEKIKESYGVNIVFKDKASKNTLITGAVPLTNLDICIEAIEKSVDVTIIKNENSLIISKK